MTIIYLHGFGSSGQSSTVKHLRKVLPQFNVLAPDIPICPSEALLFLKDYCEKYHPDLIVGTSMGGMYAMQMQDYKRMCVNPALRMSELTDILKPGTFKYFQPKQNGETHFTITEDIIKQFREMEEHLYDGVNDENRQWCWGFFGNRDTVVNCREEFEFHFAPNVQTFQGEHRMNNKVINEVVLPFVENLLDCRNSKYKKGDWVKFISDQPSVYLSRYADGDSIIKKEKQVGVIKSVHTIMKGWYSYAIETTPVHWLCNIDEGEIICKLSDEQIQAKKYMDEKSLQDIKIIQHTDEYGVTYSNYGRTLKEVDSQRFTCEEYTIPEGVEVMDGVFGLTNSKLKKIHLPNTLRKMEVNTFIRCPLEEIELPEGITEVPEFMCEGCRELKKVVLPSTVNEILIGAFNCCTKLQAINLPDGIVFIDASVFRFCESLKKVTIPSQIKEIRDELFYCSGIESIDIHKNITNIGQWAFWGCKHLRRLLIPEWVTCIEGGIVTAHEGFEGVECHAKGFHVENDALINDERQELLCCWTQQKNYVVPECVRRIADISGNEFVETITAKQPIELTTWEVFASDTNLRRVDFQSGVTGVTSQTFWNCPKLENK
jgi:predicted esterase YcpF (UPF0227 family)